MWKHLPTFGSKPLFPALLSITSFNFYKNFCKHHHNMIDDLLIRSSRHASLLTTSWTFLTGRCYHGVLLVSGGILCFLCPFPWRSNMGVCPGWCLFPSGTWIYLQMTFDVNLYILYTCISIDHCINELHLKSLVK